MSRTRRGAASRRGGQVTALMAILVAAGAGVLPAEVHVAAVGGFEVMQEVEVPATPEAAWKAFTGDITPWWDHHFSKKPARIVLDPRLGSGFYELFDDQGNGALHATVIFVERPKRLRFTGPLGYSGFPVDLVHTVDFTDMGGGKTRVSVLVRAAGQIGRDWAEAVDQVWHHLLVERFEPYIEALAKAAAESQGGAGEKKGATQEPKGSATPPPKP